MYLKSKMLKIGFSLKTQFLNAHLRAFKISAGCENLYGITLQEHIRKFQK